MNKHYVNKLDNLNKMHTFLETHIVPNWLKKKECILLDQQQRD